MAGAARAGDDSAVLPEQDYLNELTQRLTLTLDLRGAYVIGSAALGGYRPGESDLDVLAVSARPTTGEQRQAVVETCRHEALPCPARKLELVAYGPDGATAELNTGPGEFGIGSADPFWFVLDRAIAVGHRSPRRAHAPIGRPEPG